MTTRTMTPPPFVDLYAALELEKGASSGAIKKAYRALALRWHPDKNAGDAEAHARFQDIGKAYAVLSDPKKRAYYDTTGDVEDIDVSADDFVSTFVAMMDELLGGGTIEDMLDGLGDADFASMPPFPFPKHLFPPDTFPDEHALLGGLPRPARGRGTARARGTGGAAAHGRRAQRQARWKKSARLWVWKE
jgi:curved DNA-binding protein CbpA